MKEHTVRLQDQMDKLQDRSVELAMDGSYEEALKVADVSIKLAVGMKELALCASVPAATGD